MKTTSIVLAALAAGVVATPAFAQDSGYVQVNLGASVSGEVDLEASDPVLGDFEGSADLETGMFGSIAAGGGVGGNLSVEGEVLFFGSDIDTGEADAALGVDLDASARGYGAALNAIYTFNAGSFSPYIGGGVGYGMVDYEFLGESEDDGGILWQIKAGVTMPVSDNMTVDVGYRYLSMPAFDVSEAGTSITADASAHVLSVGARFSF